MPTWPTIARFIAAQGGAALVTLAQAQGSSPREVGARMVVAPDGTFTGTIGGGALEWGALAEAQALLARRDGPMATQLDKALGPDLGQCCGGRVLLTIEKFGAADSASDCAARRGRAARGRCHDDRDGRQRRAAGAPDREPRRSAVRRARPMTCSRDGRVVRTLRRRADAVLSVRRRPCRARARGRAGAAAVPVTWIDARPGAIPEVFPANVTGITQGDPVELLAPRAGRRVRRRDDAQPRARSRSRHRGAERGPLSLCRADRQRDQARALHLRDAQDGHGGGCDRQARLSDRADGRSATRRRPRSRPRSPRRC